MRMPARESSSSDVFAASFDFRGALRTIFMVLLIGSCCVAAAVAAANLSPARDNCLALNPDALRGEGLLELKLACDAAIAESAPNAGEAAALYLKRGRARVLLGKTSAALNDFDKAVALAPFDAEVYYWRGTLLFSLGFAEGAETNFTKSLSIERTWQTLNARCWARYNLRKNDAWTDCDEALAKNRNAKTLIDTAFMTGNTDYAQEAEKRSDADARVYVMGAAMWQLYASQRSVNAELRAVFMKEARSAIERGLARFPKDPQLQMSLKELANELP